MKAYAIKGPKLGILHVSVDENEAYTWQEFSRETEFSPEHWKQLGYTCVPVEVTEGDEAVRLLAALREHFKTKYVVGDEIYAEIDAFEKEQKK